MPEVLISEVLTELVTRVFPNGTPMRYPMGVIRETPGKENAHRGHPGGRARQNLEVL
jgi:hypothetical protein